jgi:hypothetical protein
MDKYRTSHKINSIYEDSSLIKTLNSIIKDRIDLYLTNEDSLRKVLESIHNFDYDIKLFKVEVDPYKKSDFIKCALKNPDFKSVIDDSLFNNFGYCWIKQFGKNYLITLATKNNIKFDEVFSAGFSSLFDDTPRPVILQPDWLCYGGNTLGKEVLYSKYSDREVKPEELGKLPKEDVKTDENNHFTICLDMTLSENKNINRIIFFNNLNKKIAEIKIGN